MPETSINIPEKLQKIGQTAQDFKDAIVNQFKDMDVEVKDWNFAVGKVDKEYPIEVNVKLGIRSKKGLRKTLSIGSKKREASFFKRQN